MKLTFTTLFVILVVSGNLAQSPSPSPGPQTTEEKKAGLYKTEERRQKERDRAHLASKAEIELPVSAKIAGQLLSEALRQRGYTMFEYLPLQKVSGTATRYKIGFSAPLTGDGLIKWRIAFKVKYGRTSDPYSVLYFELVNLADGRSRMAGKNTVAVNTVRELAVEDLTHTEDPRYWLDSFLQEIQRAAEAYVMNAKP